MTRTPGAELAGARVGGARDPRRLRPGRSTAPRGAASSSAGSARSFARAGGDQVVAGSGQPLRGSPSTSLSARIGDAEDVVAVGQALEEPVGCLRGVRPVPDLAPRGAARSDPGRTTSTSRSIGRPEEALRGLAGSADHDLRESGTMCANSRSSEADGPSWPGAARASISTRDRLARVAENLGVLECDVREKDELAHRGRSSRRGGHRGRLPRPQRPPPRSANSAKAAAVKTSTGWRPPQRR